MHKTSSCLCAERSTLPNTGTDRLKQLSKGHAVQQQSSTAEHTDPLQSQAPGCLAQAPGMGLENTAALDVDLFASVWHLDLVTSAVSGCTLVFQPTDG
jgi:hypothetical protein